MKHTPHPRARTNCTNFACVRKMLLIQHHLDLQTIVRGLNQNAKRTTKCTHESQTNAYVSCPSIIDNDAWDKSYQKHVKHKWNGKKPYNVKFMCVLWPCSISHQKFLNKYLRIIFWSTRDTFWKLKQPT